jgi:hypothetical protein
MNLETSQQIDFVNWFKENYPDTEIWHIPSGAILGGKNKFGLISVLKRMGWVNGIPDLFIPAWGVWIEFKSEKGKLSPAQRTMLERLNAYGYQAFVAFGLEQAKVIVLGLESIESRFSLGK